MATRAEQARSAAERSHAKKKAAAPAKPKSARASSKRRDARKARTKPDTNLNLREEMVKGSPDQRYRKARAKGSRVRARGA